METLTNTTNASMPDTDVLPLEQGLHIVLVAHNVAKTIESYLRRVAVYCQTLAPSAHRITVIDCESTDRTLALAELVARELPGVSVKYTQSEELYSTLASLQVADDSIVIYADLARHPDPVTLQDGAHAISELGWDVVATVETPDAEQKTWRAAAHRMKNSLRPTQRDDISFLALRGSLFHAVLNGLQQTDADENLSAVTAQIFATAQAPRKGADKVRYMVRQAVAPAKEHPLAPLSAALTVSVSAGLLGMTVFTQLQTTV